MVSRSVDRRLRLWVCAHYCFVYLVLYSMFFSHIRRLAIAVIFLVTGLVIAASDPFDYNALSGGLLAAMLTMCVASLIPIVAACPSAIRLLRQVPLTSKRKTTSRVSLALRHMPNFTPEEREELKSLLRMHESDIVSLFTLKEEVKRSMRSYPGLRKWVFLHDFVNSLHHLTAFIEDDSVEESR